MNSKLSGLIVCMALLGTSQARAATISGTAVTNVYFGINSTVTIDTDYGLHLNGMPLATFILTSDVATAAGQSFAAQLAADPAAVIGQPSICIDPVTGVPSTSCASGQAIPGFVLKAVSASAGPNILGLNAGAETVISPDPAKTAFDAIVGFNPSFVLVDPEFEFTYEFDTTLTTGLYSGDQLAMLDNFQFFQATPIPAALPLFATGLGALGLLGWRRRRKAAAVAT